jgi:hypothetical protein
MNSGLDLGHAMAEVAANHAGDQWKTEAFIAFREYAMKHPYFTTEQVRAANPDLPAPPDARAWGAIALQAKRDGVVIGKSWVRANSPTVHGMVITQWASQIYREME